MVLKRSHNLIFVLTALWALCMLSIAAWWIYLLIEFSEQLSQGPRVLRMIFWEGGFFFILTIVLFGTLLILFLKDRARSKSLHAFFGSLTHELKTPLASMRLQAEVIHDQVEETKNPELVTLSQRLILASSELETEMDKILQLSRMERGGNLSAQSVDLISQVEIWKNFTEIPIEFSPINKAFVWVDEFALNIIMRNLIQNTKNHTSSDKIVLSLEDKPSYCVLTYGDNGHFDGDPKKLGTLFYHYGPHKGSGIGLYLCRLLTEKMGGKFQLTSLSPFQVELSLPKSLPQKGHQQ